MNAGSRINAADQNQFPVPFKEKQTVRKSLESSVRSCVPKAHISENLNSMQITNPCTDRR
jgi:hypothetical protein